MSGNLLITTENGRGMKTYGLAGFIVSNMKIVFLCIVTGISCSARASEDIGPYPGIRFGLSQEQKPLEDSIEDPQPYNFLGPILKPDTPWPDDQPATTNRNRKLSDLSEKLSESIRDIIKIIKQRKRRYPFRYPKYDSGEQRKLLDYFDEDIRDGKYKFHSPHQRILYDYPPDGDFRFHGEAGVEPHQEPHELVKPADEEFDSYQSVSPVESSGKGFVEYATVDNSAEFAYSPFDPRYYENLPSIVRKATTPPPVVPPVVKLDQSVEDKTIQSDGGDHILIEEQNGDDFYTPQQQKTEERQVDDSVQVVAVQPQSPEGDAAGVLIIAFVAGISAAATVGLIAFGIGWYNLQKHVKNASDVEYPAYGITGPNKDVSPSGDRRLAQSAQMYHYQHQKQQIIAMESRSAAGDRHGSVSEADSDEENEEGDYTVYECPGLAPTGEMEVKNPLFQDDPTPAQTPASKASGNGGNQKK